MAERLTPQEIQDIFDGYDKAVLNGTAHTKEWQSKLKDAQKALRDYDRELKESLKKLGTSFVDLGKKLGDGEVGASVFNGSLAAGGNALTTFIGDATPATKAIGMIIKAGIAYVGAVTKQADSLYKGFQDVSRTGTVGFSGMREVYSNMQKFGYGVNELDKFGALMSENSESLAKFGGNAVDGAKAFANIGTELQHSGLTAELLNMGISVDEINKGAAGFIKQQIGLGLNQKNIGDKLTSQTAQYINELETISRLTGQTREQQEQKIADAQAEQAYNAKMSALKKKADAGDIDAKRQYDKFDKANRILEGDMRKQFIRGIGGDISALGPLVNVAGEDLVNAINDPSKDINDVIGSLTRGFKSLNDSGGEQLAQINAFNDAFGDYSNWQQLYSQFGEKDVNSELAKAEANKKATDSGTKNMTQTEISLRKSRDNLQDFINFGIDPVTKAVEILSKVVEWITEWIPGAGRAKAEREMQKRTESIKTTKVQVWKGNELVTVTPEEAEKIKAGETTAPTEQKAEGKGLTGKDLGGLEKSFATAITKAADEYFAATGKKVNIVSALRDSAKQKELYEAYISGKSKFPAGKPGTSKHEKGLAVDVDLASANALDSMGLLAKYGLSRPVAGDPIHISAKDGFDGILTGPSTGYTPSITMHGTEALKIEPTNTEMASNEFEQQDTEKTEMLTTQLDHLDSLYRTIMKQNDLSTKILQRTS